MATAALTLRPRASASARATTEPRLVKVLLTATAVGFMGLFLVVPLVAVFAQAFEKGWAPYVAALREPMAASALKLTLLTAGVAVPLILLFGRVGILGPWAESLGLKLVFSVPGLILATIFVTFPFVARELIPLMQAEGTEEEEAARVLGASGFQMFWRVTVPNIKWGLLYGVVLCNARAMGEFGAVSVVSGHIRGKTNTLPLHVEILYNEYNFQAAFAAASLLAFLALVTLVAKTVVEWQSAKVGTQRQAASGAGFIPAERAGGTGGVAQHPPRGAEDPDVH